MFQAAKEVAHALLFVSSLGEEAKGLAGNKSQTQLDEPPIIRAVPLVFVADDEPDARDLHALFLRYTGMQSQTAGNGLEAVTKAGELLPDLIVMDLRMPGLTGVEATARLMTDARTRGIPIVVLTASHDPLMHRTAVDAGCDSLLTKPCAPDKLAAEIRRVLGR